MMGFMSSDRKPKGAPMKDLTGKPFDVAARLDYQDGAVVSREILKKSSGTVTLFAFDQGQGLSEHTAPFDALVQIVDGSAEISISGKSNRLKKGEMIIMPANEPHALKAIKKFKMILVMIKAK
jgi:quercetin dioxygenase-like cupin family protein